MLGTSAGDIDIFNCSTGDTGSLPTPCLLYLRLTFLSMFHVPGLIFTRHLGDIHWLLSQLPLAHVLL